MIEVRSASGALSDGKFCRRAVGSADLSERVNEIFTLAAQIYPDVNFGGSVRMKISGTGTLNSPPVRRRDQARNTQKSEFAKALPEEGGAKNFNSTGPIDAFSGLLAAQEVGEEGDDRRRARERGLSLLEKLDELRHGLLAGRNPRHQLSNLLHAVRSRREHTADPRIREVLDEIELRAAVELAKLQQSV